MILAGAGTGKTRVITARIANLIRHGVAPERILAVTFTNKAAREMLERVRRMLPKPNKKQAHSFKPTICTFHSLCVRILRRHIHHLGYHADFVIYNQSEQLGVMKRVLSRYVNRDQSLDPQALLAAVSRFKNAGEVGSAAAEESEAGVPSLARVQCQYDAVLKAANAVDFDDLILLTLRLFREFPEVLDACRAQYRYVMVDEYQDTNAAQFQLVHALTRSHRNLCVVGDDDQSIYAWRGADIANLLGMEKHFPEVQVVKLEQNYRSPESILQAANAVIRHNARRRGKTLWSNRGRGEKIILSCHADEEEEARSIVDVIEAGRMARGIRWGDQAVLYRTNQQSRPLETALRRAGVRYHVVGGQSFFDRREIRDFLSYLKLISNPCDDNSLLRIANVPARGLSARTMTRLLENSHKRQCPVFTAMHHTDVQGEFPERTRRSLNSFTGLIEEARRDLESHDAYPVGRWLSDFFHHIGFFDDLRRTEKDPESAENRIRNLLDLMQAMDERESAGQTPIQSVRDFIGQITLEEERVEEAELPGDSVTLITMHSCKGLEFPHVQIAGLEEGLLPHTRSHEEGTLDEERRLFYVAITRAMKTLRISYCLGRKKFGKTSPCHPSSFLNELPPELTEVLEAGQKKSVASSAGKNFFAAMRQAVGEA